MRTIKFRVWDSKNKKMWLPHSIFFGLLKYRNQRITIDRFMDQKEYHLMQWTGLKDKNDVEIYEGDILQGYKSEHFDNRYIVVWDSIMVGFSLNSLNVKYCFSMKNAKSHEVVGNVYQNPPFANPFG